MELASAHPKILKPGTEESLAPKGRDSPLQSQSGDQTSGSGPDIRGLSSPPRSPFRPDPVVPATGGIFDDPGCFRFLVALLCACAGFAVFSLTATLVPGVRQGEPGGGGRDDVSRE